MVLGYKLLVSFLHRVAQLGHLETLGLSVRYWNEDERGWGFSRSTKRIAVVADALVGAIRANPKLSCLDLSDPDSLVKWGPHLENIRNAVKDHDGLHSFLVKPGASKDSVYYYSNDNDDSEEDDEGDSEDLERFFDDDEDDEDDDSSQGMND